MYRAAKRLCDILIALIALLILSPILVVIMIALLLTGEHEVFYRQTRIGAGYKTFGIWKFATMLKDSPNIGTGCSQCAGIRESRLSDASCGRPRSTNCPSSSTCSRVR